MSFRGKNIDQNEIYNVVNKIMKNNGAITFISELEILTDELIMCELYELILF